MQRAGLLSLLVLCSHLGACELIADFDRGKLDVPKLDASFSTPIPEDEGDAGSGDAGASVQ